MAIPPSLRNELFKYRRRKKVGSVPGIPHERFHKSRRHVSGMPHIPRRAGYHHDIYNWGTPREYHSNLNAPAVDWTDYDQYDPSGMHHISRPVNPRSLLNLNDNSQETSVTSPLPEDDLAHTEQFLMAMGSRDDIEQAPPEGPRFNINEPAAPLPIESQPPVEDRTIDELPSLEDLKDAFVQLSEALPEDHPDLVNIRTAMRRVRDHQISEMNDSETNAQSLYSIDAETDPLEFDPLQEAEQFFNRQMELLEKSFDAPETGMPEIPTPDLLAGGGLESVIEPNDVLPDEHLRAAQALEQIVQADNPFDIPVPGLTEQDMMPDANMSNLMPELEVFDIDPGIAQINQAMDEVSQQPMQEIEPDPIQPEDDPYMIGLQMQYMPDPYAIPSPYGPMGPPPGPLPGF